MNAAWIGIVITVLINIGAIAFNSGTTLTRLSNVEEKLREQAQSIKNAESGRTRAKMEGSVDGDMARGWKQVSDPRTVRDLAPNRAEPALGARRVGSQRAALAKPSGFSQNSRTWSE